MKNVLVTGATGGLGREVVGLLLARSHHVTALHGTNRRSAEELRRRYEAAGDRLEMRGIDFSDARALTNEAQTILAGRPWDAFLHLASAPLELAPFARQPASQYETQWRIMLLSAVVLTQAILPGMRQRRRGHLLYCLSAVTLGAPPKGMASYTSAKYALWGFARSVASECAGSGVAVNCISPGPMNTPLLRNLPQIARSQLEASTPSGKFLNPVAAAQFIIRQIEPAEAPFHDANLAVPDTGVPSSHS